jgi:hypothetical protein
MVLYFNFPLTLWCKKMVFVNAQCAAEKIKHHLKSLAKSMQVMGSHLNARSFAGYARCEIPARKGKGEVQRLRVLRTVPRRMFECKREEVLKGKLP